MKLPILHALLLINALISVGCGNATYSQVRNLHVSGTDLSVIIDDFQTVAITFGFPTDNAARLHDGLVVLRTDKGELIELFGEKNAYQNSRGALGYRFKSRDLLIEGEYEISGSLIQGSESTPFSGVFDLLSIR